MKFFKQNRFLFNPSIFHDKDLIVTVDWPLEICLEDGLGVGSVPGEEAGFVGKKF